MPFKRQPHKMAKHTQAIRRLLPKELCECVWPFCGAGAWRLMQFLSEYLYFVKAEWLSFNTGLYAFLIYRVHVTLIWPTEAAALGCSVKSLFFKISENSQENTCARVSFWVKLQACTRISFLIKLQAWGLQLH